MGKANWFYLIILLGLVGCLDSSLDATDTYIYNSLNYVGDPVDYNDPFDIIAVTTRSESEWSIVVEYSGGCSDHYFYTWWDAEWQSAGQTRFFLSHNNNTDACDALVRDTLEIELDRVIYSDISDTTIIRIVNASNGGTINVDPKLARLSQRNVCNLEGTIAANTCGKGIWEDRWILLPDSIDHQPVWIIPVRAGTGISLDQPSFESYYFGVTLLFGYESGELSSSCYFTDSGFAIPGVVNCFEEK